MLVITKLKNFRLYPTWWHSNESWTGPEIIRKTRTRFKDCISYHKAVWRCPLLRIIINFSYYQSPEDKFLENHYFVLSVGPSAELWYFLGINNCLFVKLFLILRNKKINWERLENSEISFWERVIVNWNTGSWLVERVWLKYSEDKSSKKYSAQMKNWREKNMKFLKSVIFGK